MKKILLTTLTIILILSVNVLAINIDVGSLAIDRGSQTAIGATHIDKANPANASGKITKVTIHAVNPLTNFEVASFFVVSGNNLSTRDTYFIGDVAAGWAEYVVDFDIEAGDYIGWYSETGRVDTDSTGVGMWRATSSDYIPCTNQTFSWYAGYCLSVYGTGTTAEPPEPPTNVQASDGTYTDKVRITWTKSAGATGYQVYRDGTPLGWLGDVATYDDTGAAAPTITPGTASASDGASTDYVTLSIAGESTNNGATHTYKVRARNADGESGDSGTNTGYRGVGTLTYQWERSAGDSDANYSNIDGATTDPYNDTGAPENGDGRYYKCIENATGASQQTTNADRGYRIPLGSPLIVCSSTSDGTLDKLSAVSWNIAREATTGDHLTDDTDYSVVGAEFYVGNFVVYRPALYFNTSSIPADAIITSATLSLYGRDDWSNLDFDIVIQNGQPIYPHDPLEWGDYNMANYSGNGGSINTSGWSLVSYNVITSNEAGRGWIQKGASAMTKFCLRSSKDIDNIEPTDESTVSYWSAEETETGERRPKLIVHYYVPEAWIGPWNGVTISKWNTKEIMKWNGIE